MIDTHTHLYMPEFDAGEQIPGSYEGQCAAVDRAVEAGVGMMLFPNVDLDSIRPMKQSTHYGRYRQQWQWDCTRQK